MIANSKNQWQVKLMTVELAEYLIGLDKYIVQDGEEETSFLLNIEYPMNFQLRLFAPDDLDQNLMVDVNESEKKSLRINLHHQDSSTQNGLLRVDFHSRHLNPADITSTVPEKFKPFAGLWLDDYSGHIHYVVDGYKPLAWAIPLEADDFPIKELTKRQDYANTLKAFFDKINLKTDITYRYPGELI
jgi:hypothetical protein